MIFKKWYYFGGCAEVWPAAHSHRHLFLELALAGHISAEFRFIMLKIEENISLKELTTFKIGGPARYFCLVKSEDDIRAAIAFASVKAVPFLILGGGSNVIINDAGFPGLVAKVELLGIEFIERDGGVVDVRAAAGENWDQFVEKTVERGLTGLENLSGIPGTVGAAPVQNIGAYGREVKDCIQSVDAVEKKTGRSVKFLASECVFRYRDSFFKTVAGSEFVITKVTFRLRKDGVPQLAYKDVEHYFKIRNVERPTLKRIREAIIEIRSKKFPDLVSIGTAGSFFKNPIISEDRFNELKKKFPELPMYPVGKGLVKVPLAWILDNVCGFRGTRAGDAGVWENQALVLVNYGNARRADILSLAAQISRTVKEKTNIEIEPEVQVVG